MAKGGGKADKGGKADGRRKARAQRDTQSLTCPACGTVGDYAAGKPASCRVCGTAIPPPDASMPTLAPMPVLLATPARDPPVALAVVSLVCGILAVVTVWVLPVCLLLGGVAVVTGIVAITQQQGEAGSQVMAGFGIGLGALAILVMWWVFAAIDDGGSSVYVSSSDGDYDGGGSGSSDPGDSGGSSGDSGGSGGDSGDSGGSGDTGGGDTGGSSGGGDTGGGVDTGGGADAPAPVAVLVGLGLLGAAAWRRRT